MNQQIRVQYSDELEVITIDCVSKKNEWREVTITKDNPAYEGLKKIYFMQHDNN